VAKTPEACELADFVCMPGETEFHNECGCGCDAPEDD
jgi:hypothetical protein